MARFPRVKFVRPSKGVPYVRCATCNAQVFARTGARATTMQIQFSLAVALATHRRDRHPEGSDD
jgi:hypothetical protein